MILRFARRWMLRAAYALAALLLLVVGLRIYDISGGPPLGRWHTFVPPELTAAEMDHADLDAYVAAERGLFAAVRREVSEHLAPGEQVATNRYFVGSPVNPARFAQDWNRTTVLAPEGSPRGAAVLLHGLTDAPYSLRHVAEAYRAHGFVAIAIRLPGHGTVPAGLTAATWEDWMAAARLAMREARARLGPGRPIHLVGYSNGGALALKHALDAIEDTALPRAERIVLISPMVGVTAFARFAGIAGLPALLPRFARAAWLDVLPEFNPFKYNSFPVDAARQTHILTTVLQGELERLAAAGQLAALPPLITFQSVVDATVSTPAVLTALYARLPANGSEIVLFDLNRNATFGPLFTAGADAALDRILPPAPRAYATTILANAGPAENAVVLRHLAPGATAEEVRPLGLAWPHGVFSLSHVALPFPPSDGLYGSDPDPAEDFGVRLGAVDVRGERGVLAVNLESLARVTFNPFFPYLLDRVVEGLPDLGTQ